MKTLLGISRLQQLRTQVKGKQIKINLKMSSDLQLSKEEAVAWLVEVRLSFAHWTLLILTHFSSQNNAYSAKMDVDAWLDKFYTADATVQYANSPARSVMDAREVDYTNQNLFPSTCWWCIQMFKAIWAKFDGLEHDVIHVGKLIYITSSPANFSRA